ncbi:MAG: tRNA 2-thiouridine(34) synthase MnmA [Candidatus Coatesbacteria bacterium]|nr:tRNA 2-thiouridine(34) synthase MnmA [Candidatus Coatesbacteria bacterium]
MDGPEKQSADLRTRTADRPVLVGLSGGVDSAVAAGLLHRAGARVGGLFVRTCAQREAEAAALDAAHRTATELGIEFTVHDAAAQFQRTVLREALRIATAGGTPSVCPYCNARLKLAVLAREAERRGTRLIATGHYARVTVVNDVPRLRRAAARERDQSYFLHQLAPELLERLVLPLGGLDKSRVRALARRWGLIAARRPDSMDLCPALADSLATELIRRAPQQALPGPLLDHHGRELGTHQGLFRYTIGQRRGLGLGGGTAEPLYVVAKDPGRRALFVGPEELLWSREIDVELQGPLHQPPPAGLTCRPRRNHPGAPVEVLERDDGTLRLRFLAPQRALTPGQIAVLYADELVVGGGVIRLPRP